MEAASCLRLAAYFFVVLNPFSPVLFLWDLLRSKESGEFAAIGIEMILSGLEGAGTLLGGRAP